MLTKLLGAAAIVSLFAIAPAVAAEMDCTEANMTKAEADMGKMSAGEKKTDAMKEMSMAKDMMAKKDMAGCKTHMNKAAMDMGMSK